MTYRQRIETAFEPLIKNGFSVASTLHDPESFGNTQIVLVSDAFKMRFTCDRGQYFLELATLTSSSWYALTDILYLLGKRNDVQGFWEEPEDAVTQFNLHKMLLWEILNDQNRLR